MATAVKQRRGTATEHDTDKGDGSGFTGLEGEITVDTTNDTIRVHDGSQVGGHRLAKHSELSTVATAITTTDESSDTTCFPLLSTDATGNLAAKTDASSLTYNASNGTLSATTFSGALTGNVTGDVSGSSGSCTGNSATATTATNVVVTDNENTDEDNAITFVANADIDGSTSAGLESDGNLTYNPSTGTLTATNLSGALNANQLTGTIDDARIPSGIARDSELSSFITASSSDTLTNKSIDAGQLTGTIDDARIPSGIARDSELSSFITASSTDTLTNKSISGEQINSGTIPFAQLPTITSTGVLTQEFLEVVSATASSSDNACHPVLSIYDNADRSGQSDNPSGGLNNAGALRFYFNNKAGDKTFAAGMRALAVDIEDGAERAGIEFCLPTGGAGDAVTDVTASHSNIESPVMSLFKYGLVMASGNDIFITDGELNIGDSTGSKSSDLHPRTTIGNTEQGGSSGQDSKVALPDCQSVLGPATLSANFLFGNNIESDRTTMSTTEVCSMRGSGLFIYNDADGLTLDLPAVSFSDSATTLRPGDELKFVSFLGTITFDVDASGTAQTVYKIGNTTNGTAALATNSGNFTLPAGGYMTLRAAFTNVYIIVEHCGVSGI